MVKDRGVKRKRTMWVLGGVMALLLLCCCGLYVIGRQGTEEARETVTVVAIAKAIEASTWTPTARATRTLAPMPLPTATPAVEELLQKIAGKQFGQDLQEAELRDIGGANSAIVIYHLGLMWDEAMAVRMAVNEFMELTPQVFGLAEVEALKLRAYAPFSDVYGRESDEVAFEFIITRETAEKIQWDNVTLENVAMILDLEGEVYVHSALQEAWLEYKLR